MTSVALRAPPVFAATVYETKPLPVWGVGVSMVIHAGTFATVQVQVAPVVTFTGPIPPVVGNIGLVVGDTVEFAHGPAACVTECVAPAITMVALRAGPVLGATEKVTGCEPVCGSGVEIVIHEGRFDAVQVQLGWAVTFTVLSPPPSPKVGLLVGETVELGQHAPCACDIETVAPAMVNVALCAGPLLATAW